MGLGPWVVGTLGSMTQGAGFRFRLTGKTYGIVRPLHSDWQIVLLTMPGLPPTPGHPCSAQHHGGDNTERPASGVPGPLPYPVHVLQSLPAMTTLSGPSAAQGKALVH